MSRKEFVFSWERFWRMPIVGIARGMLMEEIISILPIYHAAGLTTIEITMNSAKAADMIRRASNDYAAVLNIGAGTVCNIRDLDMALEAGATFIVTPITDEQVISNCVQHKIPVFAGAYTPTEIFRAWQLGADLVKVFPSNVLGPEYIKDLQGPLNHIKLLPTGGVNLSNCVQYFNAGAAGIGVGSLLFNKSLIQANNWHLLAEHFRKFTNQVKLLI